MPESPVARSRLRQKAHSFLPPSGGRQSFAARAARQGPRWAWCQRSRGQRRLTSAATRPTSELVFAVVGNVLVLTSDRREAPPVSNPPRRPRSPSDCGLRASDLNHGARGTRPSITPDSTARVSLPAGAGADGIAVAAYRVRSDQQLDAAAPSCAAQGFVTRCQGEFSADGQFQVRGIIHRQPVFEREFGGLREGDAAPLIVHHQR